MFTEKQEEYLEVLPSGHIQIKTANIVLKDGVEIAKTYHRCACYPGEDVSTKSAQVQAVAALIWTQDIIDAYQASQGE